jgi:membrane protein required for colicin V production
VNLLDFAVLALVLLAAIRGYFRGFFREVFGLAAWLGAGLAGYLLGPTYGPYVSQRWTLPIAVGEALAAIAIFLGIYIVCQVMGAILHHIARALLLGPVERAGGLVVGAAKAIAISALLCMVVTSRRGMPDVSERVHDSPMLTTLVEEGWNVFAIAREQTGLAPNWQHPYSKAELDARKALNHFLTPKPSETPAAPSHPRSTRTGAEG